MEFPFRQYTHSDSKLGNLARRARRLAAVFIFDSNQEKKGFLKSEEICYTSSMKFQKYEAFASHFKEVFSEYLSPIYIIICPDENERKKILATLGMYFQETFDFKQSQIFSEAWEHVNTGSLFFRKTAACYDGLDLLGKTELEILFQYVTFPNPNSCLLLGSSGIKNLTDLYKKGKKEIVILDLTKEKPWEQKQRFEHWMIQTIQSKKKQITPDAITALFQQLPADRMVLQQEIDKLICYVGEKEEITRIDVEKICTVSLEQNVFQLAQKLVWSEEKKVSNIEDIDILFPLIAQLRYQLEIGLKMGALLKKGKREEEISKAFPRLWPKTFSQCLTVAQRRGMVYFELGWMHLFELESGLKRSKAKPEILFIQFCTKLNNFDIHYPYLHPYFHRPGPGQNAFL